MRILVSCHPTQGGSGIVATELAMQMARRGHEVHLVSYARPFRLQKGSGVIFHKYDVLEYPLFKFPPHDLSLANKLAKVIKGYSVDVIHAHYAVPHAVTALLASQVVRPHRVKVVTTLHGTDITLVGSHRDFYDLIRYAMIASDALTAPSRWLAEETVKRFCLPKTPEAIPNFVDTERFTPEGRDPHPGPGGEFHIVHASNLRPVKRITDIIRVFHLVQKELKARLTIVGDGPDRGIAESLIDELGIRDRITFRGPADNMPAVLRGAHLYMLLSEYESFGLSALEAMACGTPVAVSASGGLPEFVKDGESGLLCPTGDVKCVAARVVDLLGDVKRWEAMGKAAAETARSEFCAEKVVPRYEAIYSAPAPEPEGFGVTH
jgi:N-acetyl-alpha-D-glucosaminyl L-malate synthase BshA